MNDESVVPWILLIAFYVLIPDDCRGSDIGHKGALKSWFVPLASGVLDACGAFE